MPTAVDSTLQHWQPYTPGDDTPWNTRRVVHLHRRAGFGATWREVERDLKDGPQPAIDRFLSGNASITGVPDDFESMSRVIGNAAMASGNPNRLKAWWLYRMIYSPDPLTEKLALMWHNHFATSNIKVNNVEAMYRQNEIFRELARAPFTELLPRVVKQPAVLIWLDADSNRKEHPNENLARELMELFSMGVGNYTERDVKQAARALTGWSTKNGLFRNVPANHDDGEKTIFDQSERFNGDDLLKLVLAQPSTAGRIAWRICELFFGEGATADAAVDELAAGLRERSLDVGWAVETVLRSRAFFAEANIGNRAVGPVEFVVGAVRVLEMFDPPPSTLLLSEWTASLGQDLFYPPNVFGWPGGRAWITTRSLIGRAVFAAKLVDGSLCRPPQPLDVTKLSQQIADENNAIHLVECYVKLLTGRGSDECRRRILSETGSMKTDGENRSRRVLEMILASPEAHLG